MMIVERMLRAPIGSATRIGIGLSLTEVRFLAVNRSGLIVWNCAVPRSRSQSLSELISATLANRPASLLGRVHVACVVGPGEAQLRPLHGLPQLRSAAEQLAMVAESVDRFFVNDGARMRVSLPVRSRDGELWASAVNREIVADVADACRAHRVRLIGVAPIAAALGHLVGTSNHHGASTVTEQSTIIERTDDGACLHILYQSGAPARIWRERSLGGPSRAIAGELQLPDRLDPYYVDAYAATRLRARDPYLIGEHSDDVRRERLARRRSWLWTSLLAASLIAAAWAPGALASRRAERAHMRLIALTARQRELRQIQSAHAGATTALNSIASFEASRRSATLLLAELAMALPDSTAVTALHVDSLGGTLTVLAPHATGALESVAAVPLMERVQLTGSVTRESMSGAVLERAALRFTFLKKRPSPRVPSGPATRSANVVALRSADHGGTQ